ncbi:amidohydrolase [Dehalococcoidia bacterium]|jgi:hypothetical protein|nr:amidohydrolase [Dehalococcoidia bacterium]
MGQVDLNFAPSVPVFDANIALGRRHDRPVTSETAEQALAEMKRVGIGRAVVYSAHGAAFDARDGNEYLLDILGDTSGLVPQFVCNPAVDDINKFALDIGKHQVRSVRMLPDLGGYPFRSWIVGEWLEWLASEGIPLWLPASEFEPGEVYDTLVAHPNVDIVLAEVQYSHVPWVFPMLKGLTNVHVEISRFVIPDGIPKLLKAAGHERVLFGSRFPDSPMAAQLFSLERSGVEDYVLQAICAGNLERILY